MRVECLKCEGSGNIGVLAPLRCPVCSGKGELNLEQLPEMVLYEWIKGYMDTETDDEWLQSGMVQLIRLRKKKRKERQEKAQEKQDDDVPPWYGDWIGPEFED